MGPKSRYAGIVEPHVQPAEVREGQILDGAHVGGIGHVARHSRSLVAGRASDATAASTAAAVREVTTTAAPVSAHAWAIASPSRASRR